jgi:hypothetical protein
MSASGHIVGICDTYLYVTPIAVANSSYHSQSCHIGSTCGNAILVSYPSDQVASQRIWLVRIFAYERERPFRPVVTVCDDPRIEQRSPRASSVFRVRVCVQEGLERNDRYVELALSDCFLRGIPEGLSLLVTSTCESATVQHRPYCDCEDDLPKQCHDALSGAR